jgi:hypothetical protein
VIVAIAGGVTYAVAEIGGAGKPIATTTSGTEQSSTSRPPHLMPPVAERMDGTPA